MTLSTSKLSIRHILIGLICAMALMTGGLTLQEIWSTYKRYGVSQQVVGLAGLNRNLFDALGAFRLERASMQSAVILPSDKNQSSIATYLQRRKQVDDAIAQANSIFTASNRPALAPFQRDLAAIYDENRKLRESVESDLKLPVEGRDKQMPERILVVGEKLLVSLDKASLAVDSEIRALNPALTELVVARALSWATRTYAGTSGVMVSTITAQQRPFDAKETRILFSNDASALASWQALRDMADTAQTDPVIKAAIATGQATYFSGPVKEMREKLVAQATTGSKPSMSVDQWRGEIVPALETIAAVANTALDRAIAGANATANQAFSELLTYGAILLVSLLIAMAGYVVVRSRVTTPLAQMTTAMTQLAKGDLDTALPRISHKDEIGAMASALSVFHENLVKMRELEQSERTASATRLARAQSMEAVVSDVGDVVAAAASGDFSARLQIDQADEQMQKLVAGINEINAVVDSATSEFAAALHAVAGGDLTARIETAYRGKFAELKGAINETVDRLSTTVRTIQVTSADVGLAAREITMGADDLSKRTEEQASSLEETAATTEELAASVKASAQASKDAAGIANDAMQAAQSGGVIAGQAVDAMARIESASQKISDIIRVIDDIAFQTNLLALNAAVEAARAGDAGKGFAVVASEVRTLAQRSGAAAKDISGLISSSNSEVGEGVKLVRQAGDALTQILAASQKVAATIAEISAASGEQANGIDEMSQAVAHLDEMTQANAALAEQSAASAGSLSGRIVQLNDLVAAFRTGPESATASSASYAPAPVRAAPAGHGSEPARLRKLAEAAFGQTRAEAPARSAPAPARASAPAKRAVNGRANDAGWEEF
ncbi:methyl-accepting chemotaxis protein [Bosea sp. BE125]|uniref:methyl-accepting chemotaxis protein n=1 Tax=Bosea sp. BE125 TaxID=2817909 RepID=UPI00286583C4|nr:methyl-accepting chemotaxis protein [Bosea sp. BE125]MDR6872296.1 methyl-accepting chemotaxis protein [Bosea sp. BE125]